MAFGFVKLLALATLAVLGTSLEGPLPVSALSVELNTHHAGRHGGVGVRHTGIAHARRQTLPALKQCRSRPPASASSTPESTPTANSDEYNGGGQGTTDNGTTSGETPSNPDPTTTSTSTEPTTSSTPPASTPTSSPPSQGGRKAGVAFAGRIDIAKFAQGSSKLFGIYNWSSYKDQNAFSQLPGVEFLTMLWGRGRESEFQQTVNNNPGYSRYALGMNEPDQGGQSNMDPWEAAQMWRTYLEPLKGQGYTLISPATTNSPDGKTWLQQFVFNACTDCSIDAIATHFYATDAEYLISHLNEIHDTFGRSVWLTEYACQDFSGNNNQCSDDQIWAFMKRTTEYMDSQDWMAFYAWFGAFTDEAMADVNPGNRIANTGDSTPNALGRRYLGLDSW